MSDFSNIVSTTTSTGTFPKIKDSSKKSKDKKKVREGTTLDKSNPNYRVEYSTTTTGILPKISAVLNNVNGKFDSVGRETSTGMLPNNAVGIWNPEKALDPVKIKTETFGIQPYVTNIGSRAATFGFNWDIWSLMMKEGANTGRLDVTAQFGNDALYSIDFDSYQRRIKNFGGTKLALLGELQGRVILNGQYDPSCGLRTSMNSLAIGLSDPFQIYLNKKYGTFSLIKYLGFTLGYCGSLYGKMEMLLSPGATRKNTDLFQYATIYLKGDIGKGVNIHSGESFKGGVRLVINKGEVDTEFYNSPHNMEMDLSVTYQLWHWQNKKKDKSVDIIGRAYATGIFGWLNNGYDFPPIGYMVTLDIHAPHFHFFGSTQGTAHGTKGPKTAPAIQGVTSDMWEGISVGHTGGANQAAKTETVTGGEKSHIILDPDNPPKILISAGNVKYQKRDLIVGMTGESALTDWRNGKAAPDDTIFLKSVKLYDKVHNRIYGLGLNGLWTDITTVDQPVTPPDLTAAHMYFTGGSQEFTLPGELLKSTESDGRMNISAIVEYGADTSKITDPLVFKQYNSAEALVWDPEWSIADVYAKGVKWAGYHDTDPDRVLVDPYDPTLPNDPDTNPYYASLERLEPIPLDISLRY